MSANPTATAKVTCVNVCNKTEPNCPNVSVPFSTANGPVIAKVPVTLAELTLQVSLDTAITLPELALEIKEITKKSKITQCLLVRCGGLQLPPALFLKGFIRKNIQYATRGCSNAEGVCGVIRHCTVDIPFNCTTNVTFNRAFPDSIGFSNGEEFSYFRTQSLSGPGFAEKDRLLSGDGSEFNQVTQEFFNELPYCELVNSYIVEYDELLGRRPLAGIQLPFEEKVFQQLEEKMVVYLTLRILQNRQVAIPCEFTVSGSITSNAGPREGIEVVFLGDPDSTPPSAFTDSEGNFSQSGFQCGDTYRAIPTDTSLRFSPAFLDFNGATDQLNFTFSQRCRSDTDCPFGQVCVDGICVACPFAVATSNKPDQIEILTALEAFQDNLLAKSPQGPEIIAAYKKLNSMLATAVAADPTLSEAIYQDVVKLMPIFANLNQKLALSETHLINEQDLATAVHLWNLFAPLLTSEDQKYFQQVFKEINLEAMLRKDIAQYLSHFGS